MTPKLLFSILCVLCVPCGSNLAAAEKPNIVFVLFDDLPYAGMSALGNTRIETPHMDRLVKEGMTFTRAYSEMLCAPSRCTIFTGQWSARHGHTNVGGPQYPYVKMKEPELTRPVTPETFNLAKLLKSAGYTTAIFGKWHMTEVGLKPALAKQCGFDEAVPVSSAAPYKDVVKNFDLAAGFVKRQDGAKPFFLYVPTFVTHGPHEVTKEEVAAWMQGHPGADRGLAQMMITLAKTDERLGKLHAALDERGLTGNTLFLTASDNGAYSLERDSEINKPLREGKGSFHEGGIRVPLIARWPGRIQPGSRSDSLVHFVDLLPTLAEVSGTQPPAGHKLDGRSLVPLFEGGSWANRTLFIHYPHYVLHWGTTPGHAVVQDRWKLIHYPFDHVTYPGERKLPETAHYAVGPRTELYDLQADPIERNDLAAQNPEVVAALMKQLEAWLQETGAKMPAGNPDYDPARVLFNARQASLKAGVPAE